LKKALRSLAQEISHSLVREIADQRAVEKSTAAGLMEVLLQQLAQEVVTQLVAEISEPPAQDDLETRLERLETQLQELTGVGAEAEAEEDDDEDEVEGGGSSYPNLKYAKPKYKDVESILKYVESDDDKSGLKLVIMNFND
jgi:chromosome segregation ATPase